MTVMAKLPFIVEPRLKPIIDRVGSEESGIIEIERRGYLTAGEKAFYSNATQSEDVSMSMMSLVRLVSKKYKLDSKTAYQVTSGIITGEEQEQYSEIADQIKLEFSSEINAVIQLALSNSHRENLYKALCMLMYRVNAEIDADEVVGLHPDIIDQLVDLFNDEDSKSIERLQEAADEGVQEETINELEKKSQRSK